METEIPRDHVLIRCPACGMSEATDPAVLADAPMIVCRNCGETWPIGPRRIKRPDFATTDGGVKPGGALIEAERRPLVSFSDGAEKAWAAKVEGDILPDAAVPRSRLAATAAMSATLAAVLFIAALLGGREAAVAALPDLASLYEAVGLPVNLDGLAIEDLRAERQPGENGVHVVVRGTIRNVSGVDQTARALVVAMTDGQGTSAGSRDFNPPAAIIVAGQASPFVLELDGVPETATEIVVRFRRASEPVVGESASP